MPEKRNALIPKRKTRKEPMLKEGIKRGRKAVTPLVDKNDKIPAIHLA